MIPDVSYQYRHYVQPYLRDPKKKAYSLLGITLIATVLFGGFAIRPAIATIIGLRKEIADLRQTDQFLNNKIAALSTAQTRYKANKEDLYLLDMALPSSPEIPELIEIINSSAAKAGVNLESFTVDQTKMEDKSLQKSRASLTVTGNYTGVSKFLFALENNVRQFQTVSLDLKRRGDDPRGILEVDVVLNYYFMGE